MKILTFDIEEWFHLLDHKTTESDKEWVNYESRIQQNMDRIFNQLERNNVSATFFCVGWIAEKYPEIVKQILKRGYEIGSHTRMHQLVYTQSPAEFKMDVEHSIKTLQDLSGQRIRYFRAPGFSITEANKWAFEVLADLGIEIDCSVFPTNRAHGGFPSYGLPKPSMIKYNGVELKELPINYTSTASKEIIFSGGGYFRLYPYYLIKRWTKKSDYIMTYFHPRDFDAEQPVIKDLSGFRRFKSYVGLKGAENKLDKWLRDFEFVDIKAADELIDWNKVPVVNL